MTKLMDEQMICLPQKISRKRTILQKLPKMMFLPGLEEAGNLSGKYEDYEVLLMNSTGSVEKELFWGRDCETRRIFLTVNLPHRC